MNDTRAAVPADFSLGRKLKELRVFRSVTQSELAGGQITRNMLSQIERGAALPSYATVVYLSEALKVDPSYFFPGGPSLEDIIQKETLALLRPHYHNAEYAYCFRFYERFANAAALLPGLSVIFADCAYHAGVECIETSDFSRAEEYFNLCARLSSGRSANTHKIAFYNSVIRHFREGTVYHTPSLLSSMSDEPEYADLVEYFFICSLIDSGKIDHATRFYDVMNIKNSYYRSHISARLSAAVNNYLRAKELLWQIVTAKERLPYPFLFSVYCDLERYCKATEDYEGAYRCAVEKQKYGFDASVRS